MEWILMKVYVPLQKVMCSPLRAPAYRWVEYFHPNYVERVQAVFFRSFSIVSHITDGRRIMRSSWQSIVTKLLGNGVIHHSRRFWLLAVANQAPIALQCPK